MDKLNSIAKAGKLVCVDSGEYSDYSVTGFFVVLRDFDVMAELEKYKAAHPDQCEQYSFQQSAFLSALLGKGLLLEVEFGTLYLGAYSSCDELNFTPASGG